jgi:hypothetical protein
MVKKLQNEWLDINKTTAVFFITQVGSRFILIEDSGDMHLFYFIASSDSKEELVVWADMRSISIENV